MTQRLTELRKNKAENSVTIVVNTHRTAPDNQKEVLQLKNLIKEASEKLELVAGKKIAQQTAIRLQKLASEIDHSHNLEGLLLFVNDAENIEEYIRIPLSVEDRVVVADSFATRDVLRALHQQTEYYILVLNQQKTRFIKALNDMAVEEYRSPFPYLNLEFHPQPGPEAADAPRSSNLRAEYFNRIDKEVNKIRKAQGEFPVLISSAEENFGEYLKIADDKESIIKKLLLGNHQEEKAEAIAREAWKIMQVETEKLNLAKKNILDNAVDSGKFLSDISAIYAAIKEGRIQTIFVEQGFFQPATVDGNTVTLLTENMQNTPAYIDDILDEMIEMNAEFGGDAVFLPKDSLSQFQGFAAVTRY